MKKIFSLIQLAVLSAGSSAFAIVGGPFDNGDYSILMERSGFFQATFTFKNGNGYSIWTPDNQVGSLTQGQNVTPNIGTGSLITPSSVTALGGHNGNRSVFYYLGVIYFGGAFGSVDVESRTIDGYCNAQSDVTTQQSQNTQNQGFFGGNTTSVVSSSVVASNRSYVLNANWKGKITKTQPQLRFSGKGEMVIIAPNGNETLAGLAYQGYSGLIDAIVQSVSSLTIQPGASLGLGPAYAAAQQTIAAALTGTGGTPASSTTDITSVQTIVGGVVTGETRTSVTDNVAAVPATGGLEQFLEGTGPASSYDNNIVERIKVTGYRRYF
jgi:hypothetical protein